MEKKDFIEFEQVVDIGAGMDVHKDSTVVTIRGKGTETQTKSFNTFTSSLTKMKEWLLKSGVTHVAMESTGLVGNKKSYL